MTDMQFTIDETLPTPNDLMRMHFGLRGRIRARISKMVLCATNGKRPREPIKRCTITIWRYSARDVDVDARNGTAKLLLDVLQPYSKRCPNGLGIIANDDAKCIERLEVIHVPKRVARTDVRIEEV